MARNPEYKIQLLGAFHMRSGKRDLRDTQSRMHQVWNCLEFFLTHRMERIPQAELIEALWPNGDITEPTNALKNIIYRVRTVLSAAFPNEDRPFIRNSRGYYYWNNALSCTLDIEQFEKLTKQASLQEPGAPQRVRHLEQAVALYQGPLLPRAGAERWTIPLRTYFSHAYVEAVAMLGAEYLAAAEYELALKLCRKATEYEPYSEAIHALLIRALAGNGYFKEALAHYEYVNRLFTETLGLRVSPTISSLYSLIAKPVDSVETDVAIIERSLRGASIRQGPFQCEFELFQDVYNVYSHLIARTGQAMSLLLLTVTEMNGDVPNAHILSASMDTLREAAFTTLRRTDILARFSPSQYILLLCEATPEACDTVSARLEERFTALQPDSGMRLTQTRCPVLPPEQS